MILSTKTLWLVFRKLIASHQAAGGLSMKKLMETWPESGLRQSDLACGLESLGRVGLVKLEMTEQGPMVKLDPKLAAIRPTEDDLRILAGLERLRDLRRLQTGANDTGVPTADNRRAEDRPLRIAA